MDMSSVSFEIIYTFAFIIDLSVFTFDSALSFPVICAQCYIGPCGVLVPTGTVHSYIYYTGTLHSNNEFEFEIVYFIALNFS